MNIGASYSKYWWVGLICFFAMLVLCFFGAAVYTYLQPETFESTVRVQVLTSSVKVVGPNGANGQSSAEQTEEGEPPIKITDEILSATIERLDLTTRWEHSEAEVKAQLIDAVILEEEKDVEIWKVTVRLNNAEDARDIANELVKQMTKVRNKHQEDNAKKELALIDEELRTQEERVEALRKARENLSMDRKGKGFHLANRDYNEEQELLQASRIMHSTRRITLKLPRDLMEIQERAKLSYKPVSPNVPLNMMLGLGLGVLLGLLSGLLAPLLVGSLFGRKNAVQL